MAVPASTYTLLLVHVLNVKRHMVLCHNGTISSHFLSHAAWKIWIFYLDGPHNSMMHRHSSGTEFPPPRLKFSSHFFVLSAFPTSKVCQCFICLEKTQLCIQYFCFAGTGKAPRPVFKNKKWQQLSLLVQCLCSFSVSPGYSLFGISGLF